MYIYIYMRICIYIYTDIHIATCQKYGKVKNLTKMVISCFSIGSSGLPFSNVNAWMKDSWPFSACSWAVDEKKLPS